MTSEVSGPAWQARYPDLTGKVAVVSGSGDVVAAVAGALAANGTAVAVVSASKETVNAAVAAAERHGVAVFGVTAEPADHGTWERVRPHAEQRLGPIDIVVAIGVVTTRHAVVAAMSPDMGARHRGVVIEVGESGDLLALPDDVRHRLVKTIGAVRAVDVAAAVAFYASDVIAIPVAAVELGAS